MSRARTIADYASTGVTAAEFDFLDTTSGTPGSGTFLRGDKTWDTAGGSNTPTFHIKSHDNSAQIPANEWTLVDFATTVYDTGSYWVAATNKFLPTDGVTKKYFIYTQVRVQYDDTGYWAIAIYKNASAPPLAGEAISYAKGHIFNTSLTYPTLYSATMIELNGSSDYVQVYVKISSARYLKVDLSGEPAMYFGGYALIN